MPYSILQCLHGNIKANLVPKLETIRNSLGWIAHLTLCPIHFIGFYTSG